MPIQTLRTPITLDNKRDRPMKSNGCTVYSHKSHYVKWVMGQVDLHLRIAGERW